MSEQIKLKGIILSTREVGENDKGLTILTSDRGKMHVFSRGSRRVKHPLHAASQPLVMGEFMVTEGRIYNYLNSARITDYFPYVKDSLDKIYYSTYFAEFAEYFSLEGEGAKDLLNLLYVTFAAMKKELLALTLIRRIFEFKALQISGLGLQAGRCLRCGKDHDLKVISFRQGGVFCTDCEREVDGYEISSLVIHFLDQLSGTPLGRIYTFTLDKNMADEFEWIVKRFLAEHADHHFRSESMLDML